LLQQTITDLFQ